MKTNPLLMSAALFALITCGVARAGDNKAVVHTITEERKAVLLDKEHSFGGFGLQIKLQFSGPDIPTVRKYGNLKITKAQDDVGTDLNKSEDGMMMSNEMMQDLNWQYDADERDHKFFNYEIRLPGIPARKATAIKIVEGTIDLLAGGEEKVVEIKDIDKHYGKAIDDEALKKSGIEMTLVEPGKGGGMFESSGVTAKIKGDASAMKVEVLDANNESLSNGSSWSDDEGVRTVTYMTNDKLPAGAKLKITCYPGQKKITMPIKLENVALP